LSKDIGLKNFVVVANKVSSEEDKRFITDGLPDMNVAAFLPYSENIRNADRDGVSAVAGMNDEEKVVIDRLIDTIWKGKKG
jgi:CO dehydrogenase nickel-insertion accessory protein CooC1